MSAGPRIGFLATCLMNVFRPNLGFACLKLLRQAGCRVEIPPRQTCCGQPAHSGGDTEGAWAMARRVIAEFEGYDHLVGPSGSCLDTIRNAYPELLRGDRAWAGRAQALSARSHEILSFLVDVLGVTEVSARFDGVVTYHDSCAGLRGLGIREQPRRLLAGVSGLRLVEMEETEACCGFGGSFCLEYPGISERMADEKLTRVLATGADTVLGGDLGCLLNLAGRASRRGLGLRVFHAAEVLAGMASGPGLAGGPHR
jgi:L-lactate dehydrogenase complex protein LldE